MATTHDINAICSQILTADDLKIEEKLFQQVMKEKIVTKILDNNNGIHIKIFSKEQIILSHITPILHNIGFEIIDEVTYNISDNKELIYISKFNLNSPNFEKIGKAKNNLEAIITHSLQDPTIKHSKAFSLVYEENFDLKKISILRAFIEYSDQKSTNRDKFQETLAKCHLDFPETQNKKSCFPKEPRHHLAPTRKRQHNHQLS